MEQLQPVKVLGVLGNLSSGVGYVRFDLPFRDLAGFDLRLLGDRLTLRRDGDRYLPDASLLDGVSMLVFPQMIAAPRLANGERFHLVEPLCDLAQRRGIPIVYSVDDELTSMDPRNPGLDSIREAQENLQLLLARSDAYIATTEPLRKALAHHGKPIYVLPNTVEPSDWRRRPENPGDRPVRIGFAGSSSHLDDLAFLLPALRKLLGRTEFSFHLLGLTNLTIDQELDGIRRNRRSHSPAQRERARVFRDVAAQLEEIPHTHVPFRDVAEFRQSLAAQDLDIGVCPLLDSAFNRCKSALKFYEYSMVHTVTVASDVLPFRDEVTLNVANETDEWVDRLQTLIADRQLREEHLRRQRNFVLENRRRAAWSQPWNECLKEIMAGVAVPVL